MTRYLLVFSFLFFTAFSFAARDERIKVVIEEPMTGASYSGLSNLRGWTVSPAGIGRYYMHVYVDGELAFYIAPFGNRPDVGKAFPDYPNSDYGGFSTAYNYKNLAQGEHRIRVRVFDDAGNYNDRSVTFSTERFKSSFIGDEADIDLSTTTRTAWYDEQSLLVKRATIEDEEWDFLLRWDRASQSFKTEGIYRSEEQYYSGGGGFELSSGFSPGATGGTSSGSGGDTTGGGYGAGSGSSGFGSAGDGSPDAGGDGGGGGGSTSGDTGGGFDVSSGASGSNNAPVFSPSPDSASSTGGGGSGGDGGGFGDSDGGTGDGSTSTSTTDPCDAGGYNPSCTPSTSGSSGQTFNNPRVVVDRSWDFNSSGQKLDFGSAVFADYGPVTWKVNIPNNSVVVTGFSLDDYVYTRSRLSFAAFSSFSSVADLHLWISEQKDGGRVYTACSYAGYPEGSLRVSVDGYYECDLKAGESYFLMMAVCSTSADDYNCSDPRALGTDEDAVLYVEAQWR